MENKIKENRNENEKELKFTVFNSDSLYIIFFLIQQFII